MQTSYTAALFSPRKGRKMHDPDAIWSGKVALVCTILITLGILWCITFGV